MLIRIGVVCFFVALCVAIRPIDRVFQNRPIGDSVVAGLLMGSTLLAYAQHEFGGRMLLLYGDRMCFSHLLTVWPLGWLFGRQEWRYEDLELVSLRQDGNSRSPFLVFEAFGENPQQFGLSTLMEALTVTEWLTERSVRVDDASVWDPDSRDEITEPQN